MLFIVDGGMINLPVVARVEDFKEDSYIEITGANENHEWKSEPTRYENVVRCKDCKHYVEEVGACIKSDIIRSDMRIIMPNWFCADGERKDNA